MTAARLPSGLYGIADASFGDPVRLGCALAEGGAMVIQLRAKRWSTRERIAAGLALRVQVAPLGVRVVMNDDLEAAVSAQLDGLHLGQLDGSLGEARSRLGQDAILGRSTHTLSQVRHIDVEADYIGFGPVFATQTKQQAGAARGLKALRSALAASTVPVVAIGGINLDRLSLVRATGARHWAVISDIVSHPDVARRASEFRHDAAHTST